MSLFDAVIFFEKGDERPCYTVLRPLSFRAISGEEAVPPHPAIRPDAPRTRRQSPE
ncbi:MAG TPA: hypothetical protein VMP01_28665 [Pirellulaceae bacterium]|nr:hypothetical protein [Pirellulaceae bacterium]